MEKVDYITTITEEALKKGYLLHAFRSVCGLRVVSLEDQEGKTKGYGEHLNFLTALKYLEEDYIAGHRKYKEVYGKIHERYLTGTFNTDSELDKWLLDGNTIDSYFNNGLFVVKLSGLFARKTPQEIKNVVLKYNATVIWEDNKQKYSASPTTFANGDKGVKVACIEGDNSWFQKIEKISAKFSLNEAFIAVVESEEIVIEDIRK